MLGDMIEHGDRGVPDGSSFPTERFDESSLSSCLLKNMQKNYYYDMSVFYRWYERKQKNKWINQMK